MTTQDNAVPKLAALVYRVGKGCRQYPFESADELAKWAAQHPYKNETLRVIAVLDLEKLADQLMPAAQAADFVRTAQRSAEVKS